MVKQCFGINKNGSKIQFTQRGKYITIVDIIPAEGETLKIGNKVTFESQDFKKPIVKLILK